MNTPFSSAPLVLVRKFRELMSGQFSPQEKLDKIVKLVANNMVAEVCSVYVSRTDGAMELYATEGLNVSSVHVTVMKAGEGLVGLVARSGEPFTTNNAQNHPSFVYKPETGEELYHSFCGVPILRNGQAIGVLVVQNAVSRNYSEDELEALRTVSMVLAEMIASGELSALSPQGQANVSRRSLSLQGQAIADGIGLGYVVLHEPRLEVKRIIADNPMEEQARLLQALIAVRADIDNKLEDLEEGRNDTREILEAYRMFAQDRGWLRKLEEAIKTGITAEAAVERVQNDTRAKMLRLTDAYLRDRLHDLEDLGNRLMRQLMGISLNVKGDLLPDNAILVARSMGPAALLDYSRSNLRGLVLEEAGATSHVAIVARALGIATVGQVDDIVTFAEQGDALIIDGTTGEVHLRPSSDIEASYIEKVKLRAKRQEQFAALRGKPAISKDGKPVSLQMNAGLLIDVAHIDEAGAMGIGLFRTELQFMVAPSLPRLNQQIELYRLVIEGAGNKPVTFRTLDIGGDKVLPYMRHYEEENPAMGYRALRLGLDRTAILRSQLRAMIKAAEHKPLRIMFPLVSDVAEFKQAKALLAKELAFLKKHNHALPSSIQVGTMLEVPSLLFQLDELMREVDFVSVGSNDLTQFFYAVDRGNPRVSTRYDTLSPAFLRALKLIVDMGKRYKKPVTLCGEMASKPLEALALLAIGYRNLSLSPAAIGPVKAMLLECDISRVESFLMPHLNDSANIRALLLDFATREGLSL